MKTLLLTHLHPYELGLAIRQFFGEILKKIPNRTGRFNPLPYHQHFEKLAAVQFAPAVAVNVLNAVADSVFQVPGDRAIVSGLIQLKRPELGRFLTQRAAPNVIALDIDHFLFDQELETHALNLHSLARERFMQLVIQMVEALHRGDGSLLPPDLKAKVA
ncbi:hypothetical protein IPJ72_01615 [Candidatus Peregrinibacteria bacterium]|nr:MAG: hypothetical protein IPJ72_01615 [Candidatus Peregrinibacteria bacterium]